MSLSPKAGLSGKTIRFAIVGALAASLLAGCAGSSHLARAGDHAARTAGKQSRAVETAERAVQRSPNDAAARIALGQAYLDAGRFQSAATTFSDAIQLGDASGRIRLSLALAHIGAGDSRAALVVLDDARDAIPASDRGLALALAGETGRGVAILLDGLRAGENTPKLRQNLAFAYALDGQWREARIAMALDVPADKMDDRIGEWAMMSRPEDVQKRIASVLSVPAGVADAGQPVALALRDDAGGEQLAAAETSAPAAQTAAAELPPVNALPVAPASIAAAPAPAVPAPVPVPTTFSQAFAAPSVNLVSQPVIQPLPARAAPVAAARVAAAPVAPQAVAKGTHLVQLGSFSSEASARRAWGIFTARNPELRGFRMAITPAVVRGKNYWRVAAGGLDGSSALRLCSGVKNRGGACFAYAVNRTPAGARPALALASAAVRRH